MESQQRNTNNLLTIMSVCYFWAEDQESWSEMKKVTIWNLREGIFLMYTWGWLRAALWWDSYIARDQHDFLSVIYVVGWLVYVFLFHVNLAFHLRTCPLESDKALDFGESCNIYHMK